MTRIVLTLPPHWTRNTAGILAERLADHELPETVGVRIEWEDNTENVVRAAVEFDRPDGDA